MYMTKGNIESTLPIDLSVTWWTRQSGLFPAYRHATTQVSCLLYRQSCLVLWLWVLGSQFGPCPSA